MGLTVAAIVIFGASFFQTATGFGLSLIAMAILPHIFGYAKSVALLFAVGSFSTSFIAIRYFRFIQWKILLPLQIPTLVLSIVFSIYSFHASTDFLQFILGLVLVMLSLYHLLSPQFTLPKSMAKPSVVGIVMGMLCGTMAGLTSITGAPAALYLAPAIKDHRRYIATIQAFYAINSLTNTLIRIFAKVIVLEDIPIVFIGTVAMLLGTLMGINTFKAVKSELMNKLVFTLVAVYGIWIIINDGISIF